MSSTRNLLRSTAEERAEAARLLDALTSVIGPPGEVAGPAHNRSRNNGDGSLCHEYEEQARRLIDVYAEAVAPGGCFQNGNSSTAMERRDDEGNERNE